MIIEEYKLTDEDFMDDACWRWDGDNMIPVQDGTQHFGMLPSNVSTSIADRIPGRDSWDLLVYRTDSCWAFDMEEYGVIGEALISGTEVALDYWYRKLSGSLPSKGSKMSLNVFTGGEGKYDTKLVWLQECEHGMGNDYLDVYSRLDCWLCPFLQALFKSVPEVIYLDINPITEKGVDFTPYF